MLIQFYQQYYRIAMLYSYQMLSHEWDLKESFGGTEISAPKQWRMQVLFGEESPTRGLLFKICQISKYPTPIKWTVKNIINCTIIDKCGLCFDLSVRHFVCVCVCLSICISDDYGHTLWLIVTTLGIANVSYLVQRRSDLYVTILYFSFASK